MRRTLPVLLLCVALAGATPIVTLAAAHRAVNHYTPVITGVVSGFRLAGLEPDGDPLDQVVLQTQLSTSAGMPRMHLIVDSYLENFKPDTTPILPDLLNPKRTAQNLGGFLQGKVLLTDDAGAVVALGSFLAEAFIGNSSNHAVMKLYGSGSGYGGKGALKGSFTLHKNGTLVGALEGKLALPATARRQIQRHTDRSVHAFGSTLLKRIISTVSVQPAPMMGKSTTGTTGAPLHTGFGTPKATKPAAAQPPASAGTGRHISPWTVAALLGAAVSFIIAAILWWKGRSQPQAVG
jgi:hypothetical protein